MKIFLWICLIVILPYAWLNIMACAEALGYVMEEKRRQRGDGDSPGTLKRMENFWKMFWREIL